MNQFEPQKVMRFLAEGLDPMTMAPMPEDSQLQKPYLIRAFFAAADALDESKNRETRRQSLPKNTGRGWEQEEEERLLEGFLAGTSIKMLASDHQRSITAIRARLIKLGKISEFDDVL